MRLEKFRPEDRELYEELVFNEETMSMNYGRVFSKEEADMLFRYILDANSGNGLTGYYKAFTDEYIGLGALTFNEEEFALEIEYMLLPEYWGMGYGSELVAILTEMAGDSGLADTVNAITDPDNERSGKILLKNGFRLIKNYTNKDGEPAVLYSKEL